MIFLMEGSHEYNIANKPLMKVKIFAIALVILGLSACTQKTCPTYAKGDADKTPTEEKANV
tara:strand:- start:307 stop:489 length:183 start_codon:yes stop_codon:yes gene_type:complete